MPVKLGAIGVKLDTNGRNLERIGLMPILPLC